MNLKISSMYCKHVKEKSCYLESHEDLLIKDLLDRVTDGLLEPFVASLTAFFPFLEDGINLLLVLLSLLGGEFSFRVGLGQFGFLAKLKEPVNDVVVVPLEIRANLVEVLDGLGLALDGFGDALAQVLNSMPGHLVCHMLTSVKIRRKLTGTCFAYPLEKLVTMSSMRCCSFGLSL